MYIDPKNPKDFDVLAKIYEDTIVNGQDTHFKKLLKETKISVDVLADNLNMLDSLHLIYYETKKIKKGQLRDCIYIQEKAMLIAKNTYKQCVEKENQLIAEGLCNLAK